LQTGLACGNERYLYFSLYCSLDVDEHIFSWFNVYERITRGVTCGNCCHRSELFILQFCPSVVVQAVRIMCGCALTYGYKRKMECMAVM
jgi:hypothetical protein